MRRFLFTLLLLAVAPAYAAGSQIAWEPWSDGIFERAARANRFVLLDLEAIWCHWCHVMNEVTYNDPKVIELIRSRYIPVRVDQDSRPDLSRRYENYGWPATVVFDAKGVEIVKRRGYLPPPAMTAMLQEIIVDPSPVKYGDDQPIESFAENPLLSEAARKKLEQAFYETHDPQLGGSKQFQKFIDRDTVEYGLLRAARGDRQAEAMTRRTLTAALKLIDPAWGGMYQYSTDSDWVHPHFEKIMEKQAEPLRLYALAYGQFGDAKYLQAVRDLHRFATAFLQSPEGAFYTSQDADLVRGEHSAEFFALDDAGRRKLGIPAVDMHRYARENGWMIRALATAYSVTGERKYLDDARRAAEWIVAHRALPEGGYRHDERDAAGSYLEDTLAMGQAFLALYTSTGERVWLKRAEDAAGFIEKRFRGKEPGYVSAQARAGSPLRPKANVDENVPLVRFANLLYRYTGANRYREMGEHALRLLVTEQVVDSLVTAPGILLAAFESANDPLHITVVGGKKDEGAQALFAAANGYAAVYRRIEWWDKSEGNLPNPDVRYPQLSRAAAFICTENTCSLPIFEAGKVRGEIARSVQRTAEAKAKN